MKSIDNKDIEKWYYKNKVFGLFKSLYTHWYTYNSLV